MTEDFVTFELAKKLKEKGFYYKCVSTYDKDGMLGYNYIQPTSIRAIGFDECLCSHNVENDGCIDSPTISQVLKWLREIHKVYIEPCILADADTDGDGKIINEYIYWSFSVTNIETGDMIYYEYEHVDDKRFDSYEQAAIAGIEYVLDNLM